MPRRLPETRRSTPCVNTVGRGKGGQEEEEEEEEEKEKEKEKQKEATNLYTQLPISRPMEALLVV